LFNGDVGYVDDLIVPIGIISTFGKNMKSIFICINDSEEWHAKIESEIKKRKRIKMDKFNKKCSHLSEIERETQQYDFINNEYPKIEELRKELERYRGGLPAGCTNRYDIKNIKLAYALTVHKSQGSEYECVILYIDRYTNFIDRNMIYTAITRSKSKFIYIGNLAELYKACNRKSQSRNDLFYYWLNHYDQHHE